MLAGSSKGNEDRTWLQVHKYLPDYAGNIFLIV
jgi:hypothetical protein